MSNEACTVGGGLLGLALGVVLGMLIGSIACENYWKIEIIKHGSGQYNQTTAAFEWIEK